MEKIIMIIINCDATIADHCYFNDLTAILASILTLEHAFKNYLWVETNQYQFLQQSMLVSS